MDCGAISKRDVEIFQNAQLETPATEPESQTGSSSSIEIDEIWIVNTTFQYESQSFRCRTKPGVQGKSSKLEWT